MQHPFVRLSTKFERVNCTQTADKQTAQLLSLLTALFAVDNACNTSELSQLYYTPESPHVCTRQPTACSISRLRQHAGGQGVLGEDTQARATLTQASSTTPGAEPLRPGLDYLISCSYNSSTDQLLLMAGNNQGAVSCFPVLEPTPSFPGAACGFGSPQAVMSGAHDSVRHICMFASSMLVLCD